jgi:hypothetical protein
VVQRLERLVQFDLMETKTRKIVVPKEKAVFWLDKNGCWHNEHGKFQHKKVIDYFHSCIRRDGNGYYLYQEDDDSSEKVYFPYEDQVLFVFDVNIDEEVTLVLNTRKKIRLDPKNLFVKNDNLYMHMGDEIVKFAEQGLIKIAPLLEDEDNRLFIRLQGKRYPIPSDDNMPPPVGSNRAPDNNR